MKTVIGSSVGIFAKEYDMELSFTLKTNSGVVFTAATIPEFEADFLLKIGKRKNSQHPLPMG